MEQLQKTILKALKMKYKAIIAEEKAILDIYFQHPVGIGEHSELITEFDIHLEKMSAAEDKLKILSEHFVVYDPSQA